MTTFVCHCTHSHEQHAALGASDSTWKHSGPCTIPSCNCKRFRLDLTRTRHAVSTSRLSPRDTYIVAN